MDRATKIRFINLSAYENHKEAYEKQCIELGIDNRIAVGLADGKYGEENDQAKKRSFEQKDNVSNCVLHLSIVVAPLTDIAS